MIDDIPWWKKVSDQELGYILWHILGEISNRGDFDMSTSLKTRMISIATGSWKSIPTGESNE